MKNYFSKFSVRKVVLAIADAFIVAIAALISNFILLLFNQSLPRSLMVISIILSAICCFGSLFVFGAYHKMWRYFNGKDYLSCVKGVFLGISISCLVAVVFGREVPFIYVILHFIFTVSGICLFRFVFKDAFITLVKTGRSEAAIKRSMIIGGGQACKMILKEIENAKKSNFSENNTSSLFEPVCIIDDDPAKIGQDIYGVTVLGTTNDIYKIAEQ